MENNKQRTVTKAKKNHKQIKENNIDNTQTTIKTEPVIILEPGENIPRDKMTKRFNDDKDSKWIFISIAILMVGIIILGIFVIIKL